MRASGHTSVVVRAGSVELSALAQQRLIERVRAALDVCAFPVGRVELALFEDPEGGRSCTVTVEVQASFEVVVREEGPFLNPMVDSACRRALNALNAFERRARVALESACADSATQVLARGAAHGHPEMPDE